MTDESLKLTTYFGERDRAAGRFLADALLDLYERHGLRVSILVRGAEGFGHKQRLQSARRLTLSEDLPVMSVAIDSVEKVTGLLDDVTRVSGDGLITLERARLIAAPLSSSPVTGPAPHAKLTLYIGRRQRLDGVPAHRAIVDLLRARGLAGATVLLGVDGVVGGRRARARFVGANADVPMMIISVGDAEAVARVAAELSRLLPEPLMTLEQVHVGKRDGATVWGLPPLPESDPSGLGVWQKLMVYTGEQARHEGRLLYPLLVHRLRLAGASGATVLRGVWGYHGDHSPHGERFWSLRRHVPLVTVVVDRPSAAREWYGIIDELTAGGGLVTSEIVPALRATGPSIEHGGLRLADPSRLGGGGG